MSHFFILIDNSIVDFFVQKSKDPCYGGDQFLKDSPYLLGDRELERFFGYFPEESSDCLIATESFCNGKNIVLNAAQSGSRCLGGKAGTLALPKTKICLAVLEHDFQCPSAGVNLPRLEEIKGCVSSEKAVPFAVPGAPYKEYPDRNSAEYSIILNVVALELAAVFLQVEFLSEFHECQSGEIAMLRVIFSPAVLADLYHAEPVAFNVTAMDEPHDFLVGEPAVGQHIAESYPLAYGPLYHFLGKLDFGHIIFFPALGKYFAVMIGGMAALKFPGAHAVVAFLPLLTYDGEIKKNLRNAVGNSHAKAFEAENGLVDKMGMYPADSLDGAPCLLMVGVIENQAYIFRFMVGTQMYPVPQLYRYMPEGLSPVYIRIVHETVKDIFLRLDQWLKRAILLIAVSVPDAEAREKQKALEDGKQPIDTVAFAGNAESVTLRHSDMRDDRTYVLHCACHIGISEKIFDIREKWCIFVYRHGFELVF